MNELEEMIAWQIRGRGVESPDVLDAIRSVPRELFVSPNLRDQAYADMPLPIGKKQTISQPFIVALMTEALAVSKSHRILEIGTGSGWQTAILAKLGARVYTIERISELMEEARQHLTSIGISNVEYRVGDGTLGWLEEAPFDRILIAAAGPNIPIQLLKSHLADGGVAVLPAGEDDWQYLWKIVRRGNMLDREDLGGCRFVRLIGKEGYSDEIFSGEY